MAEAANQHRHKYIVVAEAGGEVHNLFSKNNLGVTEAEAEAEAHNLPAEHQLLRRRSHLQNNSSSPLKNEMRIRNGSQPETPFWAALLIHGYVCLSLYIPTNILIVGTVEGGIRNVAVIAGIQHALFSPTFDIIQEDGQSRVGSEIGLALGKSPRPWQAQLAAGNLGIEAVLAPGVVADSPPPVLNLDLESTGPRVGTDESNCKPGGGGWRWR